MIFPRKGWRQIIATLSIIKCNHIYKCIRLRLHVIQIRIIPENVISAIMIDEEIRGGGGCNLM